MYKRSKYTYCLKNKSDEMIFYNFLYHQLCKFDSGFTNELEQILNQEAVTDELDNAIIKALIKRNLIVPDDYDEQAISDMEFYKTIMNEGYLAYIIYPTMSCNFNCPYCYQDNENASMSGETVEAIIKHARKNISNYKGLSVSWFGGEPLLKMDIFNKLSDELYKICHNKKRTYSANITTNGYFFTREAFEKMLKSNTNKISITIDGLRDVHDKQRILKSGKGSFDTIIEQLRKIKEISKNIDFYINLRSNVSAEGYEDLENYVKYMHSLFGDDRRFGFSFRPVYDWGGERVSEFKDNIISDNKEKNVFKKLLDIGIPLNYRQNFEELMSSSICYASRNNYYAIETDGKISKCTAASKDQNNFFVGELKENGTMELNKNIISKWASKYTKREQCKECVLEANCSSNFCLVDKITHNNENIKCPRIKSELDYYIYLLDQGNEFFSYIEKVQV